MEGLLNNRYGVLEEPTIASRHLKDMHQEKSDSLEDFADHFLVKAVEGYPEVHNNMQALATNNILTGCKDRKSSCVR